MPIPWAIRQGRLVSCWCLTALLLLSSPAEAAPECHYGSWAEEIAQATAEGWHWIELSVAERDLIIRRYEQRAHEKILATHAYEERLWRPNEPVSFSMIFTDEAGCIQFRINFASTAELTYILDPGI